MSRQVRLRVAAVVLGGLLLGAPLLTNGTASAEQTGPQAVPSPSCAPARQSTPRVLADSAQAPPEITPELTEDEDDVAAVTPSDSGPSSPAAVVIPKTPKPSKTTRGTGGTAPASSGKPHRNGKDKAHGVPTLDFPPPPRAAPGVPPLVLPSPTESAAAAPAGPPAQAAITGSAVAIEPMPGAGPFGLLAAVAMVCVVGVSASTIRAIAAQRAYRTNIA